MSKLYARNGDFEDWTAPDFFEEHAGKEHRFFPLFLRQIMPGQHQQTRLTLTGWMLIIVAMGIGSAAYNTASNILFMTLSLVLSSLILSGILSLINFRNLEWELEGPTHLRVGEVGMATLRLKNGKRFLPSMGLCFLVEHCGAKKSERIHLTHAINPGKLELLECAFVPQVRGRGYVRLVGAESEFPFGFITKTLRSEQTHELIVWPAPIDYTFIKQGGGHRFLSGESRRKAGLGTDLLNIRPYQPGDPPRLLHWKATARLGKPMTRQLAQEGERGYWIEVDARAALWDTHTFEQMCSLVCALAVELYQQGRLEGMWFEAGGMQPIRSVGDLHNCFDQMAMLKQSVGGGVHVPHNQTNRIHFRRHDSAGVIIYIDENRAGQTDD